MKLHHNTEVHVTVVAVNGAGLRTISHSEPVYVDLTPPEFVYLYDGTTHGKAFWNVHVVVMVKSMFPDTTFAYELMQVFFALHISCCF